MTKNDQIPLSGPPPKEINLKNTPLVKVLAQVKFSPILTIETGKDVPSFQDRLRKLYPFFWEKKIQNQEIHVGSNGLSFNSTETTIHQLADADENNPERNWTLSLGKDFITLETNQYISREDFLERFEIILKAVNDVFQPTLVTTIGMRYIDQLKDDGYKNVKNFVQPELVGIMSLIKESHLRGSVNETTAITDEGLLTIRCGYLSENTTFDPAILLPIDKKSLIIDIDLNNSTAMMNTAIEFSPDTLINDLNNIAMRLYSIFRWAVTDDFIDFYKGDKL
jgi:uncharacterized protein (TIGR04255 family)